MSRAAPAMPISPKLFRHFAGVTVAVTVCVAVFADGERREAMSEEFQAVEARNAALAAEAAKMGARHVGLKNLKLRDQKRSYLAFAPDAPDEASGSYGAPMDTAAGEGGRGAGLGPAPMRTAGGPPVPLDPRNFSNPAAPGPSLVLPGTQSGAIDPRQRRRPYTTKITAKDRARLEAASRERSGQASQASD